MWAGYAIGFYGWCLIRNYDISFIQVVKPNPYGTSTVNPKTGALITTGAIALWPPNQALDTVVFPTGDSNKPISGVGGSG